MDLYTKEIATDGSLYDLESLESPYFLETLNNLNSKSSSKRSSKNCSKRSSKQSSRASSAVPHSLNTSFTSTDTYFSTPSTMSSNSTIKNDRPMSAQVTRPKRQKSAGSVRRPQTVNILGSILF